MYILERESPKGFTLIEAIIATMIAGIVSTSAIAAFHVAQSQNFDEKNRWQAFAIGQQQLELLSTSNSSSPALGDTVADVLTNERELGGPDDLNCTDGVDGELSADHRVNSIGLVDGAGHYQLCWKVTDSLRYPGLKNLRVITGYKTHHILDSQLVEEWKYVLLQKIF